MKKSKIYNIIIAILVIIAIIITIMIYNKYQANNQNERKIEKIVEQVKNDLEQYPSKKEVPYIEYEGYQVIGTIKIDKINIEYPILNISNEDSMKKSITKFWGENVNEVGNLTLAGHNNLDGTMFGKLRKLEKNDTIEILDLNNNIVKYSVFDKYITDPNDVNCIKSVEENKKEITLITCSNGNKQRLIIKAREI